MAEPEKLAEELGLEDVVLGDERRIPPGRRAVAQGLVASTPAGRMDLRKIATGELPVTFLAAPPEVAREVDFEIGICAEFPEIVRVSDLRSLPVLVRTRSRAPDGWVISPDDPGTVFVDLDRSGAVAVLRVDRTGVAVRAAGEEYSICDIAPTTTVEPLAEVAPPIAEWLRDVPDDTWLHQEVAEKLERRDSWQLSTAAGLLARLYLPSTPSAREAMVRDWRDGRRAGPNVAVRSWARTLGDEELATLDDLALAAVDRIVASIEDLEDTMAPSESWWREALYDTCRERDDLESMLFLLAETGWGRRALVAAEALDAVAEAFARSIPVALEMDDERFRRVREACPHAWWATIGLG